MKNLSQGTLIRLWNGFVIAALVLLLSYAAYPYAAEVLRTAWANRTASFIICASAWFLIEFIIEG